VGPRAFTHAKYTHEVITMNMLLILWGNAGKGTTFIGLCIVYQDIYLSFLGTEGTYDFWGIFSYITWEQHAASILFFYGVQKLLCFVFSCDIIDAYKGPRVGKGKGNGFTDSS